MRRLVSPLLRYKVRTFSCLTRPTFSRIFYSTSSHLSAHESTGPNKAISHSEFAELMSELPDVTFEENEPIVFAVSGGPDSMAMAHLGREWAKKRNLKMEILTVDHTLRDTSAIEAKMVKTWAKENEVNHTTLTINWKPKEKKTVFNSRKKRSAKFKRFCQKKDARKIVLAHTIDDQIETFLIRLTAASGNNGLASMNSTSQSPFDKSVQLLRPFLEIDKNRLIGTCKENKVPYIMDPSNKEKVRGLIRSTLAELYVTETIEKSDLIKTINYAMAFKDEMDQMILSFLSTSSNVRLVPAWGSFIIYADALFAQPLPIQSRILHKISCLLLGEVMAIDQPQKTIELLDNLSKKDSSKLYTFRRNLLAYMPGRLLNQGRDIVIVAKEHYLHRRDRKPLPINGNLIFFHGWNISLRVTRNLSRKKFFVRYLTEKDWTNVKNFPEPFPFSIPVVVRKSLPVIVDQNDRFFACPAIFPKGRGYLSEATFSLQALAETDGD